jgi:hypothetical protein
MTALARTSSTTDPYYDGKGSFERKKKIDGLESQGACRQGELIGGNLSQLGVAVVRNEKPMGTFIIEAATKQRLAKTEDLECVTQ